MSTVSVRILTKVYFLMGAFLLLAGGIVWRVVQIQMIEGDRWEEKARMTYFRKEVATRGNIVSADGEILAMTQPSFRLSVDPKELKEYSKAVEHADRFPLELDSLCHFLAENFGEGELQPDHYKTLILSAMSRDDRHLYLVKRNVNLVEYKRAAKMPLLRNRRYDGGLIGEKISNQRFYPFRSLGKITVGLMKDDTVAIRGIEKAFDRELRGTDGQVLVQKIAGGIEIPVESIDENNAIDGSDVVSTLDVKTQDVAEAALLRALRKNNGNYGVAVVMEVETGEVRAMVNLTRDEAGEYYEGYNYAIAEQVDPGSTFKLASFLAALEDKVVNLEDSIDTGKGSIEYYDRTMTDHEAHGVITYRQGFELSSNVATSRMINSFYQDKPEKFIAHLEKFGLLKAVNSQIDGEPPPKLIRPTDKKDWNGTTLPWLSIGYNIRMTPLQILTFYNAIANDGRVMEPRFVKEIRKDSRIEKEFPPRVLNASISSGESVKQVKELLEGVVERGTASKIRSDSYRIAGKTGTAQKLVNGRYQKIYSSSFCGYFPAERPRFSCYVLIDEPQGGAYTGAYTAAPVVREIADYLFSTDLEMGRNLDKLPVAGKMSPPVNPMVSKALAEKIYNLLSISAPSDPETPWVTASRKENYVEFQSVRVRTGLMPEVRGMSARDAVALLESQGMKVALKGHGRVKEQSITRGERIAAGQFVLLELD